MHQGKKVLLWFVITPFIVALFMKMGWGVESILVAMAIAAVLIWLFSLLMKSIQGLFPGWGALISWSRTGKFSYPQDENGEIIGDGWQVGRSHGGDEEYDEEEERDLPMTTALLTSGNGVGDLHPALRGPTLPTRPKGPPQYAFAFGTHTMDMDVFYGTGLIVAPELAGTNGIIWTLATELSRLRVTSLVIDFTGRFDSLPVGHTTGYLLGSPNGHVPPKLQQRFIPVVAQDAGRVGRWLIHQGGQYVMRFHSYSDPVEATTTLLYLLQGMYKWEKEHTEQGGTPSPCIVLVNQAHQVLPYQDLYSVANANPELAMRLRTHIEFYLSKGGDLGMHMYLVTDKPTRMATAGLTQDVWFVQQPQFEELRYLAESTGFPMDAFTQVLSNQALFMDISHKTSLVVTLPTTTHDILDDMVLPPIVITQVTTDTLRSEAVSPAYSQAIPSFGPGTIPESRQPVPFTSSKTTQTAIRMRQAPSQVEEEGPDFSEPWLIWVSFLYSLGRLKPGTVQHPPQDLYEIAEALGLPVEQEKMLNRNRAARMMGYVQALGAEKRSRYAAKAYQMAPQFQRNRGRGGAVKIGHDPPAGWRLPRPSEVLLPLSKGRQPRVSEQQVEALRLLIARTLKEQRVEAEVRKEDIRIGPRIIQFGIRPRRYAEMISDRKGGWIEKKGQDGEIVYKKTKVEQIMALEKDFALALNELGLGEKGQELRIRMIEVIPGTGCVGLEIPSPLPVDVTLREVIESAEYREAAAKRPFTVAMGKDINGRICVPSLRDEPHRITSGFTGSGKSVGINADICSILLQHTPDEARLLLIDPKRVELNEYNGIPHLLAPIAVTIEEAWPLLYRLGLEMDRRYEVMTKAGKKKWEDYELLRTQHPELGLERLPLLFVVIDEVADMMMRPGITKKERTQIEGLICRPLQLGRAAGIDLELGTQRPSVDVLTGLMKQNAPARVAFMASSMINSRVAIDEPGAERLLGRGDLLYLAPGVVEGLQRMQHAYLTDEEIVNVATYWRKHKARVDGAGTSSYASYTLPPLPKDTVAILEASSDEENQDLYQNQEPEEEAVEQREWLGASDPLFPLVVQELVSLLESGKEVFSVDKLRHGKLSENIPSMPHKNAAAIRTALKDAGYIGDYSDKLKGYPIFGERAEEGVPQEGEKASSNA